MKTTLLNFCHMALGLLASGPLACVFSCHAQVIQQWTHQSTWGEASVAIGMDENYMFVADNEDEILRLYARFPDGPCAAPVYSFNARPYLSLSSTKPEADLEAAVKLSDGNGTRIYWLGSHSNSKSGNLRPNRNRLFATQVGGDGRGATPYSLSYVGRYDNLRDDLLAWDRNNLHGKGANYFGLEASAANGVIAERIDGFNIEGLVTAPDGTNAYLAFRAPLVNGSGPTTSFEQRTNALIVPLLNMPGLVNGNPSTGPGAARFGAPFTLNLGGRGVRSLDCSHPGNYLISAGPTGDTSNPPVAPFNFRLFTWTGVPASVPTEQMTEFPYGFHPEGVVLPSGPITGSTVAQFVSDDTPGCWRSFTACVAPGPMLKIVASGGNVTVSWPASAAGFSLQHCTDLARNDWVNNTTPASVAGPEKAVVESVNGIRFYRLTKP